MGAETIPSPPPATSPPPTTPPPLDISSPSIPTYTESDHDPLLVRIEQAKALKLPILHVPEHDLTWRRLNADPPSAEYEAFCVAEDIVSAFFSAIAVGHDDVVRNFVARGLVSPDTTNELGETPLLAAVRAGKTPMVSTLVALGATVDAFGRSLSSTHKGDGFPDRTPLQSAAEQGHLALVRVLMEDYGADDGLMAPDGAMALRLAAMNGHREIVEYLPARRGGSWLRWKTAHAEEMRRVRRALSSILYFVRVLVYELPKCLVYDIPTHIAKAAWRRRHRAAAWCKKLPSRAKRFAMRLPSRLKHGAQSVWKGAKEIPQLLKEVALALWRLLKAIPGAIKAFLLWIGRGLKSVGKAIFSVLARVVSLLHTALSAVLSFFRSITLKDVWDGICSVLRAIFIDTPQAIFGVFVSFGKMTYEVMVRLFGCVGWILWHIGVVILEFFAYLPRMVWRCFAAIGRSIRRAYQEVMAYLDPKRM
ncbi:hypothetical protein AK830_g3264 [Neonectria ditissima]|uniref:Uncharacterized protein n=1 Tax=Neonectria ditissima TaxID=78410 RepID=A0A0P7AZV1_9HYPO|nr:hypothetical protein AK830_g3264 [Neonectria ditissima]